MFIAILTYIKSKRVCEKNGFKYHHSDSDMMSPLGDKRAEHFYNMMKEDYNAIHINRERKADR